MQTGQYNSSYYFWIQRQLCHFRQRVGKLNAVSFGGHYSDDKGHVGIVIPLLGVIQNELSVNCEH